MFLLIYTPWNNKLFSISKTVFNIHLKNLVSLYQDLSSFSQYPSNFKYPYPNSFHAFAAPFSHSCLPATPPPCSDTFCLTPNKDVTLRCRERPPMLNAVLSCTDLSQFVSLRTTVSSFHSASRRWLRHLPSPKYTFHVHTWREEREVVTKASVVFLKYDHLERRKNEKKAQLKLLSPKVVQVTMYTEGNTGGSTVHLHSWNVRRESVGKQDSQCESVYSTTTTTRGCENLAPTRSSVWSKPTHRSCFYAFLIGTHKGEMLCHSKRAILLAGEAEAPWSSWLPHMQE